MKTNAKSALIQPLLDDIKALRLKHQSLLSSHDLKISLKSSLSNHDQVVDILVSELNVPIEVVDIVFSYLSTTYLLDYLGTDFDKIMRYSKNITFETVKQELMAIRGFKIDHSGQNSDYWFLCKPIFMKFMFAKFKNEIIEFLKSDGIKDVDEGFNFFTVSYISKYNRLDLCEIVYAETDSFNGIDDSLALAAEFGHLKVVKYLTRMGVSGSIYAMEWAAYKGRLDVIKWLDLNRSEGCTIYAMDYAAEMGHIHVVKWLHGNRSEGCSTNAMDFASRNGHLDVIEWLHSNRSEGCTTSALYNAIEKGHLNIVKYLIESKLVELSRVVLIEAIKIADYWGHVEIAVI